jgi:hypothetical protein
VDGQRRGRRRRPWEAEVRRGHAGVQRPVEEEGAEVMEMELSSFTRSSLGMLSCFIRSSVTTSITTTDPQPLLYNLLFMLSGHVCKTK